MAGTGERSIFVLQNLFKTSGPRIRIIAHSSVTLHTVLENTDINAQNGPLYYGPSDQYYELDLAPPPGMEMPLWRSLLTNILERIAPERLPPLELTSQPVDVGILFGDLIELPWYRTIFSNLGDVISPELLPPLQLTSRPVDVGELLGDSLDRGWWDSLLSTLRERLSPEKLSPLHLTSKPVAGFGSESNLQVLDWSSLLSTPKVFLPGAPRETAATWQLAPQPAAPPPVAKTVDPVLFAAQMQFKRDISRSRFRQKIWIALAAAEAVFLIVSLVRFR